MKCLIVSADDFGLTGSINKGIVKSYVEGIVTSINLIPTGAAFEDAVSLAKEVKLAEIGAHLSLTETAPLTGPKKIPSCKNHTQFFLKLFLKKIDYDEIYFELKEQLKKVRMTGIRITNISSHEHIHMYPEILRIFLRLAKEYNIPYIRYLREQSSGAMFNIKRLYRHMAISYFERKGEGILKKSGIRHTDYFLGFLDSGSLSVDRLAGMLRSLKEGVTELVCHPGFLSPEVVSRFGFHANCEGELFAVTDRRIRNLIEEKKIKLTTFGEFIQKK